MMLLDAHTHSIASGHGTTAMIHQLAAKASEKQLKILCVTDHGPATHGSARESYFRSLIYAPKRRYDVQMLYGCEANILDFSGTVDLDASVLSKLNFNIASLHPQNIRPGTREENTAALICAMENPHIHMIGHPDDEKYPLNYQMLAEAALRTHTLLELNRASLSLDGYRGDAKSKDRELLRWCAHYRQPIVLGSDSHGPENVGNFKECIELLEEVHFPEELVLNHSPEAFLQYIVH